MPVGSPSLVQKLEDGCRKQLVADQESDISALKEDLEAKEDQLEKLSQLLKEKEGKLEKLSQLVTAFFISLRNWL